MHRILLPIVTFEVDTVLELARRKPVAFGSHRWIYDDLDDRRCLIKVVDPAANEKKYAARPWYRRTARARQYRVFSRELNEFIAMRARDRCTPFPIAAVTGLVETDLGLGLIVEKQIAQDGRLAPTAAELIEREGITPSILQALDTWIASVIEHNVILGDLHLGNLVFGSVDGLTPRFVMIDGFGEKNLLPRCSMSSVFNAWHSRHLYARLMRKIARLPRAVYSVSA